MQIFNKLLMQTSQTQSLDTRALLWEVGDGSRLWMGRVPIPCAKPWSWDVNVRALHGRFGSYNVHPNPGGEAEVTTEKG